MLKLHKSRMSLMLCDERGSCYLSGHIISIDTFEFHPLISDPYGELFLNDEDQLQAIHEE